MKRRLTTTASEACVTHKFTYLGQCDSLRHGSPANDLCWRQMMAVARPISFERFTSQADLSALLDEGESSRTWLADLRRADESAQAFASRWGDRPAVFLQTAGFEFVFASRPSVVREVPT